MNDTTITSSDIEELVKRTNTGVLDQIKEDFSAIKNLFNVSHTKQFNYCNSTVNLDNPSIVNKDVSTDHQITQATSLASHISSFSPHLVAQSSCSSSDILLAYNQSFPPFQSSNMA